LQIPEKMGGGANNNNNKGKKEKHTKYTEKIKTNQMKKKSLYEEKTS
jgi:hypothetical protein